MKNNAAIVISGEAGQGLKIIEDLMTDVLIKTGFYVFSTQEIMSRIRGGNNTVLLRISNTPVRAFCNKTNLLILLNSNAHKRLSSRIDKNTIILGDQSYVTNNLCPIAKTKLGLPLQEKTREIGGTIYTNIIIFGILCKFFKVPRDIAINKLTMTFADKEDIVLKKNIQAFEVGYELSKKHKLEFDIKPNKATLNSTSIINGTEAVSIGALAAGCNFMASYPMSPATGVLTYMAGKAQEFGLIVEQAEDEIAAVNMALGAWYTGARAFVTTSGGGFALMQEGISLAGVTESPLVIHIGQRPGPGTGLPTRTEQGDLNLVLHAGHGEFPRAIFTPGNPEDAILTTQMAFYIADKYQIPTFILTDQYLLNSNYNIISEDLEYPDKIQKNQFTKTDSDYKRYLLTSNGISPRGIPSYGTGFVKVDSDEHTEDGRITEDFNIRITMVNKRWQKLEQLQRESLRPEVFGSNTLDIVIIGWGSTCEIVKEALTCCSRKNITFIYCKQIYPLHEEIKTKVKNAKKLIVIENNCRAQFGALLTLETGRKFDDHILKYNGMPFSVEEVTETLNKL